MMKEVLREPVEWAVELRLRKATWPREVGKW